MAEPLDRAEFVQGYLVEAEEHLVSATANLLRIEQAINNHERPPRVVRDLFRSLHTLKGLSAMVGIEPIVEIAHEMEAVLRVADQSGAPLSKEAVELSLRGVRAIEQRVRAFSKKKPVAAASPKLLDALRLLRLAPSSAETTRDQLTGLSPALLGKLVPAELEQLLQGMQSGKRGLRIDFSPSPENAAQGLNITSVRQRVGELAEIIKVVPQAVPKSEATPGSLTFALLVLSDAEDAALAEAAGSVTSALVPLGIAAAEPKPAGNDDAAADDDKEAELDEDDATESEALQRGTIRVDISRLDDALDKLSALVVTRFRLTHAVAGLRQRGVDVRELTSVLSEHSRELRHLRTSITRARMVSVAQLLERVPLIVRGMSRSSHKQVSLQLDTGRAELDKAVAERIFPAVVHLVRNAVDHAIETPEERQRQGKAAYGEIIVRCFQHSDSQLELSISDDGRGIDGQRVAAKAGRPLPVDDRGLLELITLPGLSTQERATENSGRGMGMDIVKRIAVGTLGGELTMRTEAGVGTTFTLRIPLSISILDAFSFECGAQSFVVPLAMVEEIVELDPVDVFRVPQPHKNRLEATLLRRRGETLPLFNLSELFGLAAVGAFGTALSPTGSAAVKALRGVASTALIVRRHGVRFAFSVDRMLGQQEVVIRPLEDPLVKADGISGTTDLGDGRPTLVLDLSTLSETASELASGVASGPSSSDPSLKEHVA